MPSRFDDTAATWDELSLLSSFGTPLERPKPVPSPWA